MCKEMPVIPVNKVVDPKRIIGKTGGQRRRRGFRKRISKLSFSAEALFLIRKSITKR
jgi:hypothetical protein